MRNVIMTLNDMARAMLIEFAAREAGPTGSLEEMKAILWCIRNRVKAGWYDGDWTDAVQLYYDDPAASSHERPEYFKVDFKARALQRLLHEIDSIFYADRVNFDEAADGIDASIQRHNCKYWQYATRVARPSFVEAIARDQKNHPMRAQMGLMMFFE